MEVAAIRQIGPNHLIFGDKFNGNTEVKEHMPNPYGPHCVNQQVRTDRFREAFFSAFARKEFVGWCWCGWLDHWEESFPEKQHAGVQDAFGRWDQPIQKAMKEFSESIYSIAAG